MICGLKVSLMLHLYEDETNGLVTYDRQVVKVKKEDMLEIAKAIEDKFYSQF